MGLSRVCNFVKRGEENDVTNLKQILGFGSECVTQKGTNPMI